MSHEWRNGEVFVFGSNRAGIHGKGAAKEAYLKHGACWGNGNGLSGNSYAIPTKDAHIQTLPLSLIKLHVDEFIAFSKENADKRFFLTRIGCGLAGYGDKDIAPMFKNASPNVRRPEGW